MTTRTLSLAGVLAVLGLAASLAIHEAGQSKLGERAERLRGQAEEIRRLSAENERLSNHIAQAEERQSLPLDQLRELLKLRGQVGLLRKAGAELPQLEATNARLRAGLAGVEQQLAQARSAPNFWDKNQLTFAGYAEPEATLRTMLWAMNNGDAKAFLGCLAPGPLAAGLSQNGREPDEAEMKTQGKALKESLASCIGFRIVDKQSKSPDEVLLNLSFDGESANRKFLIRKVGTEWKLAETEGP